MFSKLIDEIYEAGSAPELWPNVIEKITKATDSAFGSLVITSLDKPTRWTGTPDAGALISDFVALKEPLENPRFPLGRERALEGFFTDADIAGDGKLFEHPFYTDFMYPRGYGWVAATAFGIPTGELAVVSFERKKSRGPLEPELVAALDAIRPHLGRASVLSARLGLERANAMTEALRMVGIPAGVLRLNGSLLSVNDYLQKLIPKVVLDRRERVQLSDSGADALLGEAIARLRTAGAKGQSRSIPFAATEENPPMIIHVLPVRGVGQDTFVHGLALLMITPVDRSAVPSAEVLQGLFDYTPAEARVARAIVEGKTIDTIALANGVSRETIRTHVASILAKSGVNRQADLVALLGGLSLPSAAS